MTLDQFMNRLYAVPNGKENVMVISMGDYDQIEAELKASGRYRCAGAPFQVADNCGVHVMVGRFKADNDPTVFDALELAMDYICETEGRNFSLK